VVKLVIKPRIFSPVARQPALPHSLGFVLMLEPNMKLMGPSGTHFRHILVVTLCAGVTLIFDLFSPKLGHVTRRW